MKSLRNACSSFLFLLTCVSAVAQTSGPDTRQISDPKAIASASNPNARPIPIDDLYFTRNVSSASWSPDGKEIAFTTNISGRSNLWKVNADGAWPIQLTQSDERQLGETFSPDGKWIVFQQDTGGNELWDVFAVPSGGGEVINLTNTPEIREESPRWSPDGKTIALNTKPKDGTVYDITLMDWATRKMTPLTHEGTPDHVWPLLITSNEKGGYQNVGLLDSAGKKLAWVTETKWEAGSGDFSPDGKWITYTINADGRVDTFIADIATMRPEKIPVAGGVNGFAAYPSSFSPSGDRLLLSHESSVEPGDFWVYDLSSRKTRQLTYSAIASLNSAPRAPSQVISYKSFDGKTISALLWIPFNLNRDGSNPALVLPHGGPTGQSADYWSRRVAAFVSRGYVCIEPNVRGSTGYGVEFQKANYKDLGGGDLQDEVYAAKFLEATGYVNPKKIGITGGSYGGFMTLMAIGKTPDVWAAGVELYGIIDWMTMLQHSDPELQQYEKSLLGDPVKDRSVYDAASPITYIHSVKAPLLVLQGDNDPRVPKEEAEQVVTLLKKDGKTVDAHYYANEGHGFEKRENQIDSIRRTVAWFDKYLKGTN